MCNKIVVALSRRNVPQTALAQVKEMAEANGCDVILFAVAPTPAALIGHGRLIPAPYRLNLLMSTVEASTIADGPVLAGLDQEMERVRYETEQWLSELAKLFSAKGIRTSKAVYFGDAAERIAEYARENGADIIAIVEPRRRGLNRLFHPSLFQKILRMVSVPVLLLEDDRPLAGTKSRVAVWSV